MRVVRASGCGPVRGPGVRGGGLWAVVGAALLCLPRSAVAAPAPTAAAAAPTAAAGAGREGFAVQPFANLKGAGTLDHLRYGLPALIAERLGAAAPLRFEGPPELFSRTPPPPTARWLLSGSFDRVSDGKLTITVQVHPTATPEEVAASASSAGAKDDAPTLALEAAIAALSETPGVRLPPETLALVGKAPFARDPYAFVLYGRGVGAFQASKSLPARAERALAALTKALVVDPRVPETRRYLALVHLAAGRPGPARAALNAALERRPDYASALRMLAGLDRAASLPTARERYARLLALDPQDLEARRTHGDLLAEAGLLTEAQRELETVLRAAPDDLRVRRSLVLVLAARQAGKELCTELEEVVRLDPENIDARMELGAAYLNVGRAADAAQVYEEVLRRRPRHPGALKLAADLARERGELERASGYYAKLRWLAPTDPRPLFLMATAHAEAGNLELAERLFAEAARFPGMRADALSNLGALALKRGEPRQALWYLQRAAKGAPAKSNVRYNHALALHRVGRDGDALTELRAAEAADPADAGVRFLAGVVALRLGLVNDAVASFREAVRIDPRHEDARHNLTLLEPLAGAQERSLSFHNGDSPDPPPPPETRPARKGR
jgi:Flp pilus assembly protein TadD